VKILIRQFLGKNHSWAVCGWGWARALKQLGHQVELFSTDGIKHLPPSLKENLIGYTEENQPEKIFGRVPSEQYDCQISYTCMKNFPFYLTSGNKNRIGVWVWEWAGKNSLPVGFAKHYKACDFMCPPSQYGKQVFMDSGIPESALKVIPHGIDVGDYQQTTTIKLPTNKKCKILTNIAQNHLRKNIPGMLEAYCKAFTNKDDVCLILKAKEKAVTGQSEVSLSDCLRAVNQKYPKHAEIKIFSGFVEDISSLYRSVDIVYTMAHCEGFYFPGLEGIASGKMSIAPNWGGQLDFLNASNALLVEGTETRANVRSMYWAPENYGVWFQPSVNDAVEKLRHAYQNYQQLNQQVDAQRQSVYDRYAWKTVASQFLELCT
jgi:glycosyltransferase involved in cell wall biosynthesis